MIISSTTMMATTATIIPPTIAGMAERETHINIMSRVIELT